MVIIFLADFVRDSSIKQTGLCKKLMMMQRKAEMKPKMSCPCQKY